MKKSLFLLALLGASFPVHADMVDGVYTSVNTSCVWTEIVITPENQDHYLTKPGTEGNVTFNNATAAVLNIGVSQGEGKLIIDGGKLITPNCLFVAGKGINNPGATDTRHNGSVTVTNGGELTIAGMTWGDPFHNADPNGAQLSLANSTGVTATLDITVGGKVHANARTCVGGGNNCSATINVEGAGSVMDFDLRGETQADNVQLYVGLKGNSDGTINVKNGAKFTAESASVPVAMFLGLYNTATGTLNVENATADLGMQAGSGAVLGYSAGTKGNIHVTHNGHLTSAEIQVGKGGTGQLDVDATSSASINTLLVANGAVINEGTMTGNEVGISGSSSFTSTGTLNINTLLVANGTMINEGTMTGNEVGVYGSSSFTSTGTLNIDTLFVADNAEVRIEGATLHVANLITVFNSESYALDPMINTGGNAAGLASSAWAFELSETVAQAIDGGATRWITDMTGIQVRSYYSEATRSWYKAMEEAGKGTYIGKVDEVLDLGGADSAQVVNSSDKGTVNEGEPIQEGKNIAQVVNDNAADLFIKVETEAVTESDTQNGVIQVELATQGETKNLAVNDAYITSSLTLVKTDLQALGAVNATEATINLTNSNIAGASVGSVVDSVIKGTGTLTNLNITSSSLIAGNSPGLMELGNTIVNGGSMSFYVGDEAAQALKQGANDLTLTGTLVTSGFKLTANTVLTGNITLELWSEDGTFAYDTGRIFNTLGMSLQLFIIEEGADLANANFTLGDSFAQATSWGWDTSRLKSEGIVSVTIPEPATATLSLLALAALASRRRRK